MTAKKLLQFEVTKTNKIRDSRGEYVKRGEMAHLAQDLAEHYHKLGFIKTTVGNMFEDDRNDDSATNRRSDAGSDEASSGSGRGEAVSDSGSGSDDEGATGEEVASDVGTDQDETSEKRASNRRRRRTAG